MYKHKQGTLEILQDTVKIGKLRSIAHMQAPNETNWDNIVQSMSPASHSRTSPQFSPTSIDQAAISAQTSMSLN